MSAVIAHRAPLARPSEPVEPVGPPPPTEVAREAPAAGSTRLVNHWVEMAEWRNDRQLWAFYLTFGRCPELQAYVQRQQSLLSGLPGLDLVQAPWLHLTVQGVAFVDSVDGDAFQTLTTAGANVAASAPTLELLVGMAVAEDDSVTMPVRVNGGMTALRDELRDAARGALNGAALYALPEPVGGFAPHITIAYARDDSPTVEEVRARLDGFLEPPLRLEVGSLSLVRLCRGSSRWWWTEEYPLQLTAVEHPDQPVGPGPHVDGAGPSD
ncbi:2'-5' RNA ligase family protein [uncultured Friedmanniella sp.]|uniref:2'-5' RNA ligase family protein n=1 Tax=uncultured Friedmanniella sp. TaxID=335381 RepID=UPI0035CBBC29